MLNQSCFCTDLEELYLPATIKYFSEKALEGLKVKKLYIGWSVSPVLKVGFVTKGCTLYVPKGSLQQYKEANIWKACDNIIEEP